MIAGSLLEYTATRVDFFVSSAVTKDQNFTYYTGRATKTSRSQSRHTGNNRIKEKELFSIPYHISPCFNTISSHLCAFILQRPDYFDFTRDLIPIPNITAKYQKRSIGFTYIGIYDHCYEDTIEVLGTRWLHKLDLLIGRVGVKVY